MRYIIIVWMCLAQMSKKKSDVSGDGLLYEQENHISKGVVRPK